MYGDTPITISGEHNFNKDLGWEAWDQNIVDFCLQGLNGAERNSLSHN